MSLDEEIQRCNRSIESLSRALILEAARLTVLVSRVEGREVLPYDPKELLAYVMREVQESRIRQHLQHVRKGLRGD